MVSWNSGLLDSPLLYTHCMITNKNVMQTHNYVDIMHDKEKPTRNHLQCKTTWLCKEIMLLRKFKRLCQPQVLSKIGQSVQNYLNTTLKFCILVLLLFGVRQCHIFLLLMSFFAQYRCLCSIMSKQRIRHLLAKLIYKLNAYSIELIPCSK